MKDSQFSRRRFLKHSAVGALGLAGFGARQDGGGGDDGGGDDSQALVSRRFAFNYPERLGQRGSGNPVNDLPQKILLVTDRKDEAPDQANIDADAVAGCIDDWSAGELQEWEAIIVEWRNPASAFVGGGVPKRVRATQLVEVDSVVTNPREDPIELGTPFIIRSAQDCPGDIVGVTASQIPGVKISTGPGVSTGEGD